MDGNPGRAGGRQDVSDAVLWADGVRKLGREPGNNSVMEKRGKDTFSIFQTQRNRKKGKKT